MDSYEDAISLSGQELKYSLEDACGPEGFQRIRTLYYPKTDVFLCCYSVCRNHPSYVRVKEHWIKEVNHSIQKA